MDQFFNSPTVGFQPPMTFMFGLMNYIFQTGIQTEKFSNRRAPGVKHVLADTHLGRVKGVQDTARGNHIYRIFRGIPYAKPPVGKLRFEPPVPHPGWDDVYDATWYGAECWQIALASPEQVPFGDEDCLFINVATRKTFLKGHVKTDNLRPVFVWIYGGMFMVGSSNIYEPKYFLEHDIVFVTFNYRLNSFGFLNTGDGIISGNMGLKDQSLALQWVWENIEFFNGDPTRITIMGESSGAASVHMHTLSPMSRGLFSGAVSLSGNALSPWALIREPKVQAREFATAFDCSSGDTKEIIKCLKKVPAEALTRYHSSYVQDEASGKRAFFGPTIDSNSTQGHPPFLPSHPQEMLESNMASDTPWIYGVTSGEGLINIMPIYRSESLKNELNRNWEKYLPGLLFYQDHPKASLISKATKKIYMRDKPLNHDTLPDAVAMASDRAFFYGSHEAAMLHSKMAPVYAYYYAYEGLFAAAALGIGSMHSPHVSPVISSALSGGKSWVKGNLFSKKPKNLYGICHGDDLPIMFSWPFLRKEISDKDDVDYKFSKKLISLWVSFGENGTPDPRFAGDEISWPPIREQNHFLDEKPIKMLLLNKTWSLIEEPFNNRIKFWKRFDSEEYRNIFVSQRRGDWD